MSQASSPESRDVFRQRRYGELLAGGMDKSIAWTQSGREALAYMDELRAEAGFTQPPHSRPAGGDHRARAHDPLQPAPDSAAFPESLGRVGAPDIEWVAAHVGDSSVGVDSAPTKAAASLLTWARSSMTAQAAFWQQFVAKMMPTRDEMRETARVRENMGAVPIRCIERLQRARAKIEANRLCARCKVDLNSAAET